ncbi:MAG TPA: serine/threonine-protein kinase, partial [Polyangiaceae bacterium]|nr:serine/threonine-protein kinase [Polyangiaceae bacterium]
MTQPTRPRALSASTPSLGDVPLDPSERASFARRRLSLFGQTVFWIAVTFLGLSALLEVTDVLPFWRPGMESHLLATLLAFVVWRLPRGRWLDATGIQLLDTLGTLGICVAMVVMGHRYAAQQQWGLFAGIFAVFHVTMARAIIVPSTPGRTLVVTALSFAGLVVSQSLLPAPPVAMMAGPRWMTVIPSLTWSATVTALATLASKVIFGLQERVFEARKLGQYTLEEKIGEGGMGEVYRASHALLRRPTAIKLLSAKDVTEEQARRFEKEVQLTAGLTHPNTISIFDYGRTPEGTFYYAMELLDGITLEQLVEREGAQPPSRVIHILLQMCGALREAHEAGLIHRDIKPANAILCSRGGLFDLVKVLDFGLVKQIANDAQVSLSNADAIVGTPLFMSPEEISSPGTVGPRSDLYSLGAVAYYLLSGAPVFAATNVIEVCGHHLHTPPEPLSTRARQPIPTDLEALVHACLSKPPD